MAINDPMFLMIRLWDTGMAQHFLLSVAARTLSLKSIYVEGEEAAYRLFCQLCWPETNGKPVCPQCCYDEAYSVRTRRKFKCKACHHQFSVTSGTMFASHKLAFVDLLGAIALVANAAKGYVRASTRAHDRRFLQDGVCIAPQTTRSNQG